MASFSLSDKGLNLSLPTITGGPPSNYAVAGNAGGDVGRIFRANRRNKLDIEGIISQHTSSQAMHQAAVMDAEAAAKSNSLIAIGNVESAKRMAEAAKEAARKKARGSMFGSAFGALATIGGTLLAAPLGPLAPVVGSMAGKAVSGATQSLAS